MKVDFFYSDELMLKITPVEKFIFHIDRFTNSFCNPRF